MEGAGCAIEMHSGWKAKDKLSRLFCSLLELKMSQQLESRDTNSLLECKLVHLH